MSETIPQSSTLRCPDCGSTLPAVRSKTPWCECGWSSISDEWFLKRIPPWYRRAAAGDIKNANRLVLLDEKATNILTRPAGKWLWNIYIAFSLILSVPVLTVQFLIYGLLLTALGFSIASRFIPLIFIMCLIIGGLLSYELFAPKRNAQPSILLPSEDYPQLFSVLDQVSIQLHTRSIDHIRVLLNADIGVRQVFRAYWKPRFEHELILGLFGLYSLNTSQFISVSAHEFGHFRQKDPWLFLLINRAIENLNNWASLDQPGSLVSLKLFPLLFPFFIFLSGYMRLLIWVSRWAIRRQEYQADLLSAQLFGKEPLEEALINLGAIGIASSEYFPIMWQRMKDGIDQRDFYNQFVGIWEKFPEATRQEYYAKAVASLRSVYDTHPSYQDRQRFLSRLEIIPELTGDNTCAVSMVPDAAQLGRDLTVKLIQGKS